MHQEVLTPDGIKIWSLLNKFDGFYLAGGTGLALQIGHRISVDFDFFSDKEIDTNLLAKTKRVFEGLSVSSSINNPNELTVFVDNVKVSFIKYPFPVIEKFHVLDGINVMSVKEIGATKAYTIGRRGTYKDYVDLYYIISENHASLKEIIDCADIKFGSEFNSRLFLEQLIFLDDIEDIEIKFLKEAISKKEILDFFLEQIKNFTL